LFGVLFDRALDAGVERMIGEFIPTPKNALVRELYPRLGFSLLPGTDPSIVRFELSLARAARPSSPIVIEPNRDG
jgi:predicted enzyme involved in methoxymalonyl-ACP biosynthesis